MGDKICDYVDNGGVVCSIGAANGRDCIYTVAGRWKKDGYQTVKGKRNEKMKRLFLN